MVAGWSVSQAKAIGLTGSCARLLTVSRLRLNIRPRTNAATATRAASTRATLKWKTNSENQLDRAAHGTVMRKWTKKVTAAQGEQMRALRPTKTLMELAEMFGCSFGTVCYHLKYREQRGHAAGKQPHWTPEEDEALRATLPGRSFRQAAEALGRSAESVQGRAYKLGLRSGWNGAGGISHEQRRLRDAALVQRHQ